MNRENCTDLLAGVFAADPIFIHLFSPDASGLRLRLIMRFLLELSEREGVVLSEGERPDALLAYYPPERFPVALWRTVPFLLHLVPEAIASPLSLGAALNGLRIYSRLEKLHPTEPHNYVAALAVDPAAQGKGVGGRLFGRFLDDVDTRKETVYLESSNPKNHSFYHRNGFEIVQEFRYTPETPPIWCMFRSRR